MDREEQDLFLLVYSWTAILYPSDKLSLIHEGGIEVYVFFEAWKKGLNLSSPACRSSAVSTWRPAKGPVSPD